MVNNGRHIEGTRWQMGQEDVRVLAAVVGVCSSLQGGG